MGVVLAMIHHFQQLFDVKSLNGVYPTMTRLYHQLHESNTAYKQLNKLTGIINSILTIKTTSSMS